MRLPDTLIVDGRAYSWRLLCQLRRQQLEEWRKAHPDQPALFELRDDARPRAERKAAGRLREPTLLCWLEDNPP